MLFLLRPLGRLDMARSFEFSGQRIRLGCQGQADPPPALRPLAGLVVCRLNTKAFKVIRVRRFALLQSDREFTVQLSAYPRDHAVSGGGARRTEVVDAAQSLQVLEDLFEAAVQLGDGPVDVDLHRHELGGHGVGEEAAHGLLRQSKGAFSFTCSHFALLGGDVVRARSVFAHRALPVG